MKKRFHLVSLVLLGMLAGAVPIFKPAFGDTPPSAPGRHGADPRWRI